jgi:orotate phosphoribosyltransferase
MDDSISGWARLPNEMNTVQPAAVRTVRKDGSEMESGSTGDDRQRLIALLKRDALRLGSFTLASGRTSHYYIDGRRLSLSAEGAALIGNGVLSLLTEYPEVTAVGGLTLGADPIVGATLALAPLHGRAALRGFLVRKQVKTHGTGNLVEGPLDPGAIVAIVDDVATTGGSSLQAVDAALALGCKVAVVIAVLDRLEGAGAAFAARGLVFRPLLTLGDLGLEPLKSP